MLLAIFVEEVVVIPCQMRINNDDELEERYIVSTT